MTGVFASLSSIDVGVLVPTIERLERAGVDGFHIDLSDGVFTPGIIFGPGMVAAVASRTHLPVEAHLMTVNPEGHVSALVEAGASRIAFHWEATRYPWRIMSILREAGVVAGIGFNPGTRQPDLDYLADSLSFVNILTTEPDVIGERLLPAMGERIAQFRSSLPSHIAIEVDGGVEPASALILIGAGADDVVMGRALISSPDPGAVVAAVREAGRSGHSG